MKKLLRVLGWTLGSVREGVSRRDPHEPPLPHGRGDHGRQHADGGSRAGQEHGPANDHPEFPASRR